MNLCIPIGERGYAVKSANDVSITFVEQYFRQGERISDADKQSIELSSSDSVVAVLTSLNRRLPEGNLVTAVQAAAEKNLKSFQTTDEVELNVREGGTGQKYHLKFNRVTAERFEADADRDSSILPSFDRWIAIVRNGRVDHALGCFHSLPSTRTELVCRGSFTVNDVQVLVSLFGGDAASASLAFDANRAIILSFVAR